MRRHATVEAAFALIVVISSVFGFCIAKAIYYPPIVVAMGIFMGVNIFAHIGALSDILAFNCDSAGIRSFLTTIHDIVCRIMILTDVLELVLLMFLIAAIMCSKGELAQSPSGLQEVLVIGWILAIVIFAHGKLCGSLRRSG